MNLVEQTLLRLGGHVANISYQRFLHVMDLILQQDVFPSGQLMSKIYSKLRGIWMSAGTFSCDR